MGLHIGFRECHVRRIPDNVDETRTVEFVISSEQVDRYGTVLLFDKWNLDNFNKNPVVGYNHPFFDASPAVTFNPDKVIGIGKAWKDTKDKLIIGSVKFETADINPVADKLFRKVKNGTIRSTSVGFVETKEGTWKNRGKENETYYYGSQELLEFSIVDIPANTDAVVRNATTMAAQKLGYHHFIKDDQNSLPAYQRSLRDRNIFELDLEKMKLDVELLNYSPTKDHEKWSLTANKIIAVMNQRLGIK